MGYLLTNGIITEKIEVYIKDMIQMNFKLYPTDLPYNTQLGIERRLHNISMVEFEDIVRMNLTEFITRLNRRHGLNLSITQLDVTPTRIDAQIDMGDKEVITYELPLNQ
jgi:hypothetical protein